MKFWWPLARNWMRWIHLQIYTSMHALSIPSVIVVHPHLSNKQLIHQPFSSRVLIYFSVLRHRFLGSHGRSPVVALLLCILDIHWYATSTLRFCITETNAIRVSTKVRNHLYCQYHYTPFSIYYPDHRIRAKLKDTIFASYTKSWQCIKVFKSPSKLEPQPAPF